MAVIKPFRSIRPIRGKAAAIAALPYDVYNREEAKKAAAIQPDSFLFIDRAEINFPDAVDMYESCVYEKARALLWERVAKGDFVREEKPCYYLYELTMNGRVQTGIVACASIDDYRNQLIKKHENTREEKEWDRIRHVEVCGAQTGPIFLTYRSNEVLARIVIEAKKMEPEYDFTSQDGIRHRVFVISDDAQIAAIGQAFAGMDALYIADGHHRCASAVKVGMQRRLAQKDYTGEEEFNFFLSVLFPAKELSILPYHRVILDLNGYSPAEFQKEVEKRFMVTKLSAEAEKTPKQKGIFHMYLDRQWFACKVKKEDILDDPVKALDVSLLQELLLEPVLQIKDPKTDSRIDFVGGIRGIGELKRRCETDCAAAFAMYPTAMEELFAVADAGRLMPPKSTWFEPKLRSGLFIHEI